MKLHQSRTARTPWPPLSEREQQAWRLALPSCHGVSALLVDLPPALRDMPSSRPLHKLVVATADDDCAAAVIDPQAWPFRPQTFDAVLLAWNAATVARQSRVLTEMDSCLADEGRVLMLIPQAHLAQWCRAGMAQAQALGWQLQAQHWGDVRRLSLLPAPLARYWVAPWQRYLPVAQWCVQHWQKTTYRVTPLGEKNTNNRSAWAAAWPSIKHRNTHE